METKYVTGLSEKMGGAGDPSPFTAYGVYMGMKACAKEAYGNDSLENRKVAVQGVGHVGHYLVKHLIEEGANVLVSDIGRRGINLYRKNGYLCSLCSGCNC